MISKKERAKAYEYGELMGNFGVRFTNGIFTHYAPNGVGDWKTCSL